MNFKLGDKVHSKLMGVTGTVTGFFNNRGYLITDQNGYQWSFDSKAELVKVEFEEVN